MKKQKKKKSSEPKTPFGKSVLEALKKGEQKRERERQESNQSKKQ
jgi:hypothetical protein